MKRTDGRPVARRLPASIPTAAAVLAAAAVTFGCNRAPNTMTGTQASDGDLAAQVAIANRKLEKRIALEQARSRMVNDFLQATVVVRSQIHKPFDFEYKFQWFDADGFELRDTTEHWQPTLIQGMERKRLQSVAGDPRARSFKLMIRSPQPVKY